MLIKLLLTIFFIPVGAAIVTAVLVFFDKRNNTQVSEYDDNSYH